MNEYNLTRVRKSLALLWAMFVTLLYSCTAKQSLFNSEVYIFPGIFSLDERANGSYLLSWQHIRHRILPEPEIATIA